LSFVWICACKDLRRQLRDPAAIGMWFGIPLIIATLMVVAFGGNGSALRAIVLVSDDDDSVVSELLAGAFTGAGDMFAVEKVSREEGLARMDDGDATALLHIPAGFGQAVLKSEPVTLELVTNPAQRILPGLVEGVLDVVVDAVFYVQQVFGDVLERMIQDPPKGRRTLASLEVAAISISINDAVESISEVLDPLLIEVVTENDEPAEGGGGFNFGALLFPGILFMSLLFVAQGMSEDMWRERNQGTLRRLLTTPRSIGAFLAGKLLVAAMFMLAVVTVGLLFGVVFFDLPLSALPGAVLWGALSGTMMLSLFILVQLLAGSQRGGSTLTNMVLFPLMFLGGSFFPFEQMPPWMASVGQYTPNGWALVQFKAILDGTAELPTVALSLGVMLLFGAVLTTLSALRLRAGFARA
jgi:ABC-2 type transport system permease protein